MPTYDQRLSRYIADTFALEDEALAKIREQIVAYGLPPIMISAEEGAFLRFLAAASRAKKAIEIGTLGGYSGVWIARGLARGGHLWTIEANPRHAEIARQHFQLASLEDTVQVVEGNAHVQLPKLSSEAPFDFIFIDANKASMLAYLEWSLNNLSTTGVLCAHNAFAHGGKVADSYQLDPSVEQVREFNRRIAEHPDLVSTIFPAGDGILTATWSQSDE